MGNHVIIARAELRDRYRPARGNFVIVNIGQALNPGATHGDTL
jgi:hypothetical protein